ncbi:peptidoglycan-binding protein [Sodalinema sp.]|uniref:peptidoglycan-binding protein n=1 Tax=Sodalinema sp. TaxID=3080550 RepID=UPI00396F36F4
MTLHLSTWGNLSLRQGIRMLVVPMTCLLAWGLGCPRAISGDRTSDRVLTAPNLIAQANSQEPINLLPDFAPDLAQQLSELELAQNDSENSTETRPPLRLDDSGEEVEQLQQQLQAAGFYEGEITGQFDLETEAAVLALQEQEELQVDGIMGQDSWDRLEAQQPTPDPDSEPLDLDNIGNESDDESDDESASEDASSGLGLMWWVAGGAILVVIAGGLFIVLLKAFQEDVAEDVDEDVAEDVAEDVDEENINREGPRVEEGSKVTPASENAPELTPSANPDNGSVSQEPPPDPEIPPQNSPWETPEAPVNSKESPAFPDLPPNLPVAPKTPVTSDSQAIAPQKPSSSALTRLPRMSIVEALILDLQHPDPERRRKAIWELGQRGDSRAITPLVDLLTDASSQERSTILAVLSEISSRNLRPMKQALMVSLQDDSAEVRKNAIRDLTRIYDSIAQLSQVLRYSTDDADPEVRETAKWAMSQLQRIRTLPLNDEDS